MLLQSEGPVWLNLRKGMITASNFGKICRRRNTTNTSNCVRNMLQSAPLSKSVLTNCSYGKEHERDARIALENHLNATGQGPIRITECGLQVHKKYGYIGASPNGLHMKNVDQKIIDFDFENHVKVVEMKCLSSANTLTPIQTLHNGKTRFWKKNGEINVLEHYYYQL